MNYSITQNMKTNKNIIIFAILGILSFGTGIIAQADAVEINTAYFMMGTTSDDDKDDKPKTTFFNRGTYDRYYYPYMIIETSFASFNLNDAEHKFDEFILDLIFLNDEYTITLIDNSTKINNNGNDVLNIIIAVYGPEEMLNNELVQFVNGYNFKYRIYESDNDAANKMMSDLTTPVAIASGAVVGLTVFVGVFAKTKRQ